ncbi:NCA2-domain-containing protein [Wolfiporia cocos MD-104 SS10]|uniref:NCA2-domain-containing protein n=1 Tax=Wolfiporia cocos (strain MD-104) TaxID=742152 RepID=A0A2H3JN34_WOLCO|nr:NCA2-domain-containing protein [Wolfiporia cocos MD-104 SS10]
MSTFVSHITQSLTVKIRLPTSATPPGTPSLSSNAGTSADTLRALYLRADDYESVPECLSTLANLESLPSTSGSAHGRDAEKETLRRAVVARATVALYGRALQVYLEEARVIENELEWWMEIERSAANVALYLLQTLPNRLLSLAQTILDALRTQHLPLRPSVLTPSSLQSLFPSRGAFRPHTLTVALFPHLRDQPYTFAFLLPSSSQPRTSKINACLSALPRLALLPLELARGECAYKRETLAKLRDERAEALGMLAGMRDELAGALTALDPVYLAVFATTLRGVVRASAGSQTPHAQDATAAAVQSLQLISVHLSSGFVSPRTTLQNLSLARPSRLTLLWPRLLLLPPLALYTVQRLYASRAQLHEIAQDAVETLRGFVEGWLLAPLRDIVRTVRAGDADGGVIITRESVKADLDSLKRMALALAGERLKYDETQMAALAALVQRGDLTPVMQLYEEDIKRPLRSAVAGTLLRTLFIQVQKAKVDIDQALAGIDKLLKSQELTFAFVGVAPALAIVYVAGGYFRSVWRGGRGRGRYGGKHRLASVWLKMRRIERLLICSPASPTSHSSSSVSSLPPLTAGLLLLSSSHLRAYAEQYLPARSRLREGFLEDVGDLEDPTLGRVEKLRVVERMWRSWGAVLGWENGGEVGW